MGVGGLTKFESEVVDSVLWQLEGFWKGRVSQRATTRILRATLRRIKVPIKARSAAASVMDQEIKNAVVVDHAIPLATVVEELLKGPVSKKELEEFLGRWLVCVWITRSEHDDTLKAAGLAKCMPTDWDRVDIFARFKAADIPLLPHSGQSA